MRWWPHYAILILMLMGWSPHLLPGLNQIQHELLVEIDPAKSNQLYPLLNATFGNKLQIKPVTLRSMGLSLLHIKAKNEADLMSITQSLQQLKGSGVNQLHHNFEYSLFKPSTLHEITLSNPSQSSSIFYTPNDPYLTDASGQMILLSNGSPTILYGHNRITNAITAWDYTKGNPSIPIAVIDTGAQLNHVELLNRLWVNTGETSNDGLDNDSNGFVDDINGWNSELNSPYIADDMGHGTHVSGIIAGTINNGFGSAGVCPECRVMVLKANESNRGSFTTLALIGAIDYAVLNGARVINMSLGGPSSIEFDSADTLYELAARTADSKGVVIVAAAGNDGVNLDHYQAGMLNQFMRIVPASFPTVFTVSSTRGTVFDSSYSNYGDSVDVAAPGTNIVSSYPSNNSTTVFKVMSGTSMASPVVAGAIGLLYSVAPYMTTSNATALIRNTSTDQGATGVDVYYGYGLLNIGAAVQVLAQDTTPPTVTCLSNLLVNKGIITPISYRVMDLVTPISLLSITANYYENGVLTKQIPLPISGTPPTFTVMVHPSMNTTLVTLIGHARDVMGNTTPILTSLVTGDFIGPTIELEPNSIPNLLLGRLVLTVTDPSGVNWNSLNTVWTIQGTPIARDMTFTPAAFSQSGPTLSINLLDYGMPATPSVFQSISTFSVTIRDQASNTSTHLFRLGSTSPPTIVWQSVPKSISDPTVLSAQLLDDNGIHPTSIRASIKTSQGTRIISLPQDPTSLVFTPPILTMTLSQLQTEAYADIELSVADWFDLRTTASISIKNNGGLTSPVSGTYYSLIYPNPFNPTIGPSPRLAYALRRVCNRGTLTLVDMNRVVVSKIQLFGSNLLAGYQEVSLAPLGVHQLGNGVYMLILELWGDGDYVVHRQRLAILNSGG